MSRSLPIVLFFALMALALLLRLPFLTQVMVGEEGSFAYLVAGSPTASSLTADRRPQMMIGILGAEPALFPFQRTILPYVLLESGPGAVLRGLDVITWSEPARIAMVRIAFVVLYLIGIVGLLWRASRIRAMDTPLALAATLFAISAPLAVGASLQPQIDGALGVLLTSWAALLLTAARPLPLRSTLLLAGTAGVLVGCGRHEWSIAFLGGLGLLALSIPLLRPPPEARRRALHTALAIAAGLVIGGGLSFALSPSEYLSGFSVQRRVTGVQSPLVLMARDRLHIGSAATLLVILALMIVRNMRRLLVERPGLIVVFGAAATLFAGSFSTGWPGDGFPRYYAPVLSLAAVALVSICALPDKANLRSLRVVQLCTALALLAGVAFNCKVLLQAWHEQLSITSNFGVSLAEIRDEYQQIASDSHVREFLPRTHAGIWMSYPNLSFLSRDMGTEGGRVFLENKYPDWAQKLEP
jgi:hypothetical protein